MNFVNRDFISVRDFSKDELLYVLSKAEEMEKKPQPELLRSHLMAALFFEPSTRTRLSFISSMERLGGATNGFASTTTTSAKKGETLWDTIKMVEHYSDVIVIRHPLEGAPRLAAEATKKPVINAGDGANQHPTQTLLDLYTIKKAKKTLSHLKIGMVGDLKYGRTVHSLLTALSFFNPTFYFIAPDALKMPKKYLEELKAKKIPYHETEDLDKYVKDLDIMYVTRIQGERFADPLEYQRYKGVFKVTTKTIAPAKKDLKIMHPLPRVDEIDVAVDDTSHALYFEQAANGIPVRQAILALTLGKIK